MTKPGFIPPMLATLVGAPFDDPDWLFEVKWDGFRVEAVIDGDSVRLWTRGEQDASRYFGPFLDPRDWLAARRAVVDGEVIALDGHGEPDFALLQSRIKGRGVTVEPTPFVYEVFDLLHLDGKPLLETPLEERRRLLASVLRPDPRVRLSEHIEADGIAFFEAARARGLEGMMPKDRHSPYVPGLRTDRWLKVKIRPEQELVVGGWVKGSGKAIDLGALLVGVYEHGALRYAGKIGAGFTNSNRDELLAAVAPLAASEPPFATPPPRAAARDAQWLRPELVIRAEFARLDRRRPRPPGGLQGHRTREGPAGGDPRAPEGRLRLTTAKLPSPDLDASSFGSGFGEDLAQLRGEAIGIAWLPVLVAEEAAVAAREDDRLRAETLGHGLRAAAGHLTLRLGARADHDPRRRRSQRVEVGLVVRARRDVLEQQRVRAGAVVLGRQAEHGRIGRRLGEEVRVERPLVARGGDEMRHAGTEPAALVRVGDRLGHRHRALAVGQDGRQGRFVRDQRPNLVRVLRNEGEGIHRATAAGEEVDGARTELVDDAVEVVGVLLGC
jgi:DNA ligase D-like protein (predicted ligase)